MACEVCDAILDRAAGTLSPGAVERPPMHATRRPAADLAVA
jgi:hypothetical protein